MSETKKQITVQIVAVLAIVLALTVTIFVTFSSLIKKNKLITAESSLQNAALAVLLYEGQLKEFSGYLIYFEDAQDFSRTEYEGTVAYVAIDRESGEDVSEMRIAANRGDIPLQGGSFAAGVGVTAIVNSVLHDALKELGVSYYRVTT